MALVDYADSDEESQKSDGDAVQAASSKHDEPTVKSSRGQLPPPPSSFYNLYATAVRASTSDDPSIHGGRKRITPHLEGQWPSHVYIEWYPQQSEAVALTELLQTVRSLTIPAESKHHESSTLHSLLYSELGVPLPLHISLSRSLALQGSQRSIFKESLQKAIQGCNIRPFSISLGELKWVSNYESTRWFLVLGVARPAGNELNELLQACNTTCSSFGLPGLYSSSGRMDSTRGTPSDLSEAFHFSIGWSLTKTSLSTAATTNDIALSKQLELLKASVNVTTSAIKLKMGNEVVDISLKG